MNRTQIMDVFNDLSRLQREKSFILSGIYLPAADIAAIRADLEPDDPPVGAVGRLQTIPVYELESPIPSIADLQTMTVQEHRGVFYTYIDIRGGVVEWID